MLEVLLADAASFSREELVALYDSVGWTAYTRNPEQLVRAVAGSHRVVAARLDGQLVGLALRGDSHTTQQLHSADREVTTAGHDCLKG